VDPYDYHRSRAAGEGGGVRWPTDRLALVPNLSVRLKDGRAHQARIVYKPPALSVFLDGSRAPVLETVVDFSIATDHEGSAWIGFTAATGFGYENHDILSWSFTRASVSSNVTVVSSAITFPMSACLPNRNLCTPEHPFIEGHGDTFHVVLPANLAWGSSVPNPSGRPVEVTNAKGIVCWDLKTSFSQGCGGPSGNGVAGSGFLAMDQPAGALVMRTMEGSTWFSVNGRAAVFKDNEGYFEFDVEIR